MTPPSFPTQVPCVAIGSTGAAHGGPGAAPALVTVRVGGETVLAGESVAALRDVWESTSFALEVTSPALSPVPTLP